MFPLKVLVESPPGPPPTPPSVAPPLPVSTWCLLFLFYFSFSVFLFIPFTPSGGRPHLDPQRRDGATSTRLWGFRTCNLNPTFSRRQTEQCPLLDVFCSHAFIVVTVVVLLPIFVGDAPIMPLCHVPKTRRKLFIVVFLPFI